MGLVVETGNSLSPWKISAGVARVGCQTQHGPRPKRPCRVRGNGRVHSSQAELIVAPFLAPGSYSIRGGGLAVPVVGHPRRSWCVNCHGGWSGAVVRPSCLLAQGLGMQYSPCLAKLFTARSLPGIDHVTHIRYIGIFLYEIAATAHIRAGCVAKFKHYSPRPPDMR